MQKRKFLLITILSLLLPVQYAFSQENTCPRYDNLIKEGDALLNAKIPKYYEALRAYQAAGIAARECGVNPSKTDLRIQKLVSEIDKEREKARKAELVAKKAQARAKEAQKKETKAREQVEVALQNEAKERLRADTLRKIAEINVKSNELVALANEYKYQDAKLSFLFAKEAVNLNQQNQIAKKLQSEIYSNFPIHEESFMDLDGASCAKFHPRKQLIITAGNDNVIKVWGNNGKLLNTLHQHEANINCIDISEDGKLLVSGDRNGSVLIWDFFTHNLIDKIQFGGEKEILSVNFKPNESKVLITSRDSVFIYDFLNKEKSLILGKKFAQLNGAVFSPSGDTILITGYSEFYLFNSDSNLILHKDFPTGTEENGTTIGLFHPNEDKIIFGSYGGTIKIYDLKGNLQKKYIANSNYINKIAISSDGEFILSAGINDEAKLTNLEGRLVKTFGHRDDVLDVEFSPDGNYILTICKDWHTYLWKINHNYQNQISTEYNTWEVIYSDSGNSIFTCNGQDKSITELDLEGKMIKEYKVEIENPTSSDEDFIQLHNLRISENNEKIIATSSEGIIIWDINSSDSYKFIGQNKYVTSISILPNEQFVSTDAAGNIHCWNKNKKIVKSTNYPFALNTSSVSADGKFLFTGANNNKAQIWEINKDSIILIRDCIGHTKVIQDIEYNDKTKNFLTGSDDGIIRLWNLSGNELLSIKAHSGDILDIEFSPDGNFFASASRDDHNVIVWDLEGNQVSNFKNLPKSVMNIAFSPNQKYITVVSSNGAVTHLNLLNEAAKNINLRKEIELFEHLDRLKISTDYKFETEKEDYKFSAYHFLRESLQTENKERKRKSLEKAYSAISYVLGIDSTKNSLLDTIDFRVISRNLAENYFYFGDYYLSYATVLENYKFYNPNIIELPEEINILALYILNNIFLDEIEIAKTKYLALTEYDKLLFLNSFEYYLNKKTTNINQTVIDEFLEFVFSEGKKSKIPYDFTVNIVAFLQSAYQTHNQKNRYEYLKSANELFVSLEKNYHEDRFYEIIEDVLNELKDNFNNNYQASQYINNGQNYKQSFTFEEELLLNRLLLKCGQRKLKDNEIDKEFFLKIIDNNVSLSHNSMIAGQFDVTIESASEGLVYTDKLDFKKSNIYRVSLVMNLAHGYLYNGQYNKAKETYKEILGIKLEDGRAVKAIILEDFGIYRNAGIIHPDIEKLKLELSL